MSDARVRGILDDPTIAHRAAARRINDLLGDNSTSEKSVRRYRGNARRAEALGQPHPTTVQAPVSGSGGRWQPGIDIDPKEGGEFRTRPREITREAPEPEPEEADLLGEFDLDPAVWEVVSARKSQWQSGDRWLEARRVSFRRRSAGPVTVTDVEGIFSRYYPVPHPVVPRRPDTKGRIVMVPAG